MKIPTPSKLNMKKKEELPSCPKCGGKREITEYDHGTDKATIKELHAINCELIVYWKKVYGTKAQMRNPTNK